MGGGEGQQEFVFKLRLFELSGVLYGLIKVHGLPFFRSAAVKCLIKSGTIWKAPSIPRPLLHSLAAGSVFDELYALEAFKRGC